MRNLYIPTIISGPDPQQLANYVQQHHLSSQLQLITIQPAGQGRSIKIAQIHQLQQQLSLTSHQPRLIWIKQAHLLTLAAQNALLKTLEEPPANTQFVLTTTAYRQLLPTIISRCHLHSLSSPTPSSPPLSNPQLQLIKQLLQQSPGARLAALKQLPTQRHQLILWVDQLLHSLHNINQTTTNPRSQLNLAKIIRPALNLKLHLQQTNVNLTLALEHFLLSLPTAKPTSSNP